MRSTSATKRRPQVDKWGESRVLLSSNSLNPLSRNMSSKLDLIKQEISREFQQKFPSDKKRSVSHKKSTNLTKTKISNDLQIQAVSRKLQYNISGNLIQPKQQNSQNYTPNSYQTQQNESLRQKFYEMQDKFLSQRQKSIDNYEKNTLIKQNIIEFLQQPSQTTASTLKNHFVNQKQHKIINKFITLNEDVQFAEKTLGSLMKIMEVNDIETLLSEFQKRQIGFKNLSECSFKILELQTRYNKLEEDCKVQIRQCIKEQDERQCELKLEMEHKIQMIESSMEQTKQQQISLVKKLLINLIKSMTKDTEKEDGETKSTAEPKVSKFLVLGAYGEDYSLDMKDRKVHFGYQINESMSFEDLISVLYNIFKEMNQSVKEIEKEAEQNLSKFSTSKKDMDRLQEMIRNVTNQAVEQKEKVIELYEAALLQKEQYIKFENEKWERIVQQNENQWKQHIQQLEDKKQSLTQLVNAKDKIERDKRQAFQQVVKKQKIIDKIIRIVCDATGEEIGQYGSQQSKGQASDRLKKTGESLISKIEVVLKRHLICLKQNLQSAENMILWHEKQLQVKQELLKEFEFNLKKLVEESQQGQRKEKEIRFQRDEYKYLLANLRENVREIKKEYEQKIVKVANDKDQEYLNSNKHILIHNQHLSQQNSKLQLAIKGLTEKLKEETSHHHFNKKKSENLEQSLTQAKKNLFAAESQVSKYKQMLNEIETSFKDVENMSDLNSQKIGMLEENNKLMLSEKVELETKTRLLIKQIETKDDNYNKLQYSYEDLNKRLDKVNKLKEDLQVQNSNLRIQHLEVIQETRHKIGQANKVQHQNLSLKKQNKKLLEENGALTKKMISYMEDKSKAKLEINVFSSKAQQKIRISLAELKQNFIEMRKHLAGSFQFMKTQNNEDNKKVIEQLLKTMECNQAYFQIENHKQGEFEKIFNFKATVIELQKNHDQLKKQISEDLLALKSMIEAFGLHLHKLKELQNNQQNSLMKGQLNVKSLKEQVQSLRELLKKLVQFHKDEASNFGKTIDLLLREFQLRGNQQSSEQSDNKKQESKIQSYLNSQKDQQSIEDQNLDYQSPQFVRIRKSTHQEENESQKVETDKDDGQSQKMDQVEPFLNIHHKESDDSEKLAGSWFSNTGEEVKKVRRILMSLTEKEDPKVDYFQQIKAQYKDIKKKLFKANLHLDISAVSFRHNTVSSPSSLSFSKDFIFDKRFHTDPNEQIIAIGNKDTNRSDYKNDRSVSAMKKENEIIREHIEKLEQNISILQQKEEQYKITISELTKRNVTLENESSTQMKEKLFLKFLDELLKENWKEAKTCCRTFLKLLGLSKQQIDQKMESFEQLQQKPKKKTSNGFMSGLFNSNPKT